MRRSINWNDNWDFIKEGNKTSITLPHTWNAIDGIDGGNDYYRGTCTYEKVFEKPSLEENERVYVEFEGIAMKATVFLNEKEICVHEGGYSTFRVDITDYLNKNNIIKVLVSNEKNHIYPQSADFTFYGGIYRDVHLLIVPKNHFTLDYKGGPGIKVTPIVTDLANRKATVTVEAYLKGDADNVVFETDNQKVNVEVREGYAKYEFNIEGAHLWNGVEDPYLYTLSACVDNDNVVINYGIRTYEITGDKGFILNGKPYPLRGVSRHQDRIGVGNALTKEMHEEDMSLIREVGANSIRLAHYQHAQYFYDLCDKYGIITWAEIPYITMHMNEGRDNTLSQMEELIIQNYNHPSIVVWGLSNEITAASVVNEELLENHKALNDLAHKLDPTRKTTMADVFMLEIDSPILDIPDVNAYNLYFGWYLGELEQNDEFFDTWHTKYPNKPIGFSEYGADTNPAYHSTKPERGDYTESYQCLYHEHMLDMIEKRDWLWCTYVWNMFDFAADGRDEGGKHGQNQKGLVTIDRKIKKDAFYLYKAHWSKEPFVYITERRYINRDEKETEVKVYSNLDEVTLYVDNEEYDTKSGKYIFKFNVPINGEHTFKAVSGSCEDEIRIKYVEEKDDSYILNKDSQDVKNWFDSDVIDRTCFSVEDTLGELSTNPEAKAIIDEMMSKMVASRGDVAEHTKNNPALQKMLARMSLISLLKQAGDVKAEAVQGLNRLLQRIKK